MTEAEWLASEEPGAMLNHLRTSEHEDRWHSCVSDRKLRLWAAARCRASWDKLTDPRSRYAVEIGELIADGERAVESSTVVGEAYRAWESDPREATRLASSCVCDQNVLLVAFFAHPGTAADASLLREIIGNPFRPVTYPCPAPRCSKVMPGRLTTNHHWECETCQGEGNIAGPNPAWLTPTVVSLARAAYDERLLERRVRLNPVAPDSERVLPTGHLDPQRLLILSDALEEAGCREQAILEHLRSECDPGMGRCDYHPHVRGCWVLDLLLGKS